MERVTRNESRRRQCLPRDVIFNILLMLPAKSLMRFKNVCKEWKGIISDDPKFEELHHAQRQWTRDLRLVFSTKRSKEHWIYEFDDKGTRARRSYCLPIRPLGYCKGVHAIVHAATLGNLLLLKAEEDFNGFQRLYMYDCATGKDKLLPGLEMPIMYWNWESLVHDAFTNTYKVLVVSVDSSRFRNCISIISVDGKSLAVKRGWRTSRSSPFRGTDVTLRSSVSVKGMLYWLVRVIKPGEEYGTVFIQPFNIMKEESTNTITIPDQFSMLELAWFRTPNCSLLQIRGALCYMHVMSDFEFGIWVLKDSDMSAWVQLHRISLQSMPNRPSSFSGFPPYLCLHFVLENINNRLPRILVGNYSELYWYDMNTNELQQIDVEPIYKDLRHSCEAAWVRG